MIQKYALIARTHSKGLILLNEVRGLVDSCLQVLVAKFIYNAATLMKLYPISVKGNPFAKSRCWANLRSSFVRDICS